MVELPEEIILIDKYYNYTGKLRSCLDAEYIKKGTSLLSGKIGQKVFADDFERIAKVKSNDKILIWDSESGTVMYATPGQINAVLGELANHAQRAETAASMNMIGWNIWRLWIVTALRSTW